MSRRDDLKNRIVEHERRLQRLKEQEARLGISAPPETLNEIEDIETELDELYTALETLPDLIKHNPYRGLAAFREEDAHLFFGRERFTADLLARVEQHPFVTLLGSSGSGKSSLVFAGLVPKLRQAEEGWLIASFRPGQQPFRALAAALLPLWEPDLVAGERLKAIKGLVGDFEQGDLTLTEVITDILEKSTATNRFLLIADQFEELYTLTPTQETRRHFLDLLLDATNNQQRTTDDKQTDAPLQSPNLPTSQSPLHLVLTLRADFMGQALNYGPFANRLDQANVMMWPMESEELRQAIERPAVQHDVSFEPGLVERILADVKNEPGHLPLLEFALTELWRQQTTAGHLPHAAYESIGRVEGALSRHADAVLSGLSQAEQDKARRIFVQLVQPGDGSTADTRRLATKENLDEAGWDLAQTLAGENARLVVTNRTPDGQETVEVVHEALIQSWERLKEWMMEDRRFRIWQERLRMALQQWQASEQDDGALLRGALLTEAEDWLGQRETDVSQEERTFIESSVTLREKDIKTGRKMLALEIIATQRGNLQKVDFREVNLSGVDLSRTDLREADLHRVNLSEANLHKANLSEANLSEANLSEANLSEANLSEANLCKANLSEADLRETDLHRVDLREANLRGANLRGFDLNGVNLSEADLRGADLRGAILSRADLRGIRIDDTTKIDDKWRLVWKIVNKEATDQDLNGVDLGEANLSEADLRGFDLRGADLNRAVLNGANLSETDLRETNLSGVDLRGIRIDDTTKIDDKWRLVWKIVNKEAAGQDLSGVDLCGFDLRGADLSGAVLSGAVLREANLNGANLREANLNGAVLIKAILNKAVLNRAILNSTVLRGAGLIEVDLSGADLSGADLSGAVLMRADLSKAILNSADLRGTVLSGADLSGVKCNKNTLWSEDFNLNRRGIKCDD